MKEKLINSMVMFAIMMSITTVHVSRVEAQRSQVRTDSRMIYHDGPIMPGTPAVYVIYYGNWSGSPAPYIVDEFLSSVSSPAYLRINTTYPGANGFRPSGAVFYAGRVSDVYSHGPTLTVDDIQEVVVDKIASFELPLDTAGIYLVVASPDVTDIRPDGSTFCTPGTSPHHGVTVFSGSSVKYGFVGSPVRCPSSAAPQFVAPDGTPIPTPNGDLSADGMINTIARLLNVIITSPLGTEGPGGGWYDRYGLENSDKCVGKFGATFTTQNGAPANISTGGRDYLIQQNWVNDRKGYCSLSYP